MSTPLTRPRLAAISAIDEIQAALQRSDGGPSVSLAVAQIYALIYIGDAINDLIDRMPAR